MKNKYIFFFQRFWRDLTNPLGFKIPDDLKSQELKYYYFLFYEDEIVNQKGGTKSFVLDENGIPMNPTYVDVKDKNFVYFPITIGQYGLAVFHTYLQTKSDNDKRRFMNIVDWFYEHRITDDKLGAYWLTDVPLPQYKNPGPWQSAFVQGRALSIFLRAYQLTGEQKFLDTALDALKIFKFPVKEGGVTSFTKWGPMYEEYTASVPTLVINGHIFSLFGLYDCVRACPNSQLAHQLFYDGIKTAENALPDYDLGFWSRYNFCQADFHSDIDPATVTYHRLHISQLKVLSRLIESPTILSYIEKWKRYDNLFNIFRMYILKYKSLRKIGRL